VQDTEWALSQMERQVPAAAWCLNAGCMCSTVMLTHFGPLKRDLEIIDVKMSFFL